MADITMDSLSVSGEREKSVRFRSSENLLPGAVYEALEDFHGEMGHLVNASGAGIERAGLRVMEPGTYTYIMTGRAATAEGRIWRMENFLATPLPEPMWTDTMEPTYDQRPHYSTHPTMVKEWPDWEAEVKKRLGGVRPSWKSARYMRPGSVLYNINGPAAQLQGPACHRINTLFDTNGDEFDAHFGIHPFKRPSEEAAREGQWPGVQVEAEEILQNDAPDICLMMTTNSLKKICQTTLCKSGGSTMSTHDMSIAAIWNAVKNGDPVADKENAQHVVDAIAQELGFMSRRGHKTGIITTYVYTWLLKTDGKGCLWISDPIPFDSVGTHIKASVTEVLLFSVLRNLYDFSSKPYPTARSLGEAPISMLDFNADRMRAQAAIVPKHGRFEVRSSEVAGSRCTELRSGKTYQRPALLTFGMLRMTTRLAANVFLGSVYGTVAAVRLANMPLATRRAVLEAKVYERLKHLQGKCVPRLIAHGFTSDGKAYIVAAEFMEGTAWDWNVVPPKALKRKLKLALNKIHAAGVLHGDLHIDNILTTPDNCVFVLDFAGAKVDPTDKEMRAELDDWP